MSTREHHYTFEVAIPAAVAVATGTTTRVQVGTVAATPAAAERRVRDHYPNAGLVTLRLVSPAEQLCGDERCAVCYPSSRNRGTL